MIEAYGGLSIQNPVDQSVMGSFTITSAVAQKSRAVGLALRLANNYLFQLRLVKADKNGTTFELLLANVKDGLKDSVKDFR